MKKYGKIGQPAAKTQVDLTPAEILAQHQVQPKQQALLEATGLYPILQGKPAELAIASLYGYGGAAYGGKSYGLLLLADFAAYAFPGVTIVYFRRTYPELTGPDGAITNSYKAFSSHTSPRDGGKEWHWDNGSTLYFRYCQNEKDVYSYQSQSFDILLIDEATHFTWPIVDYLLTRNRATVSGILPFAVMTTNPGNVGHVWYSEIFDVAKEAGEHNQLKVRNNPNGQPEQVFFIPAFLEDNKIGVERDPEYEARLMRRDPLLADALRWGKWNIFAGQAFRQLDRNRHICKPFEIPVSWPKWRSIDWGYESPFVCWWWTKNPDNGGLFLYRRVYQNHLTDQQQAKLVRDMTPITEQIAFTYADPSMWSTKNQMGIVSSTAKEYADAGVILTQADNDRLGGKRRVDRILADLPDGMPGFQIFENCSEVFQKLSVLILDRSRPEDVDSSGDDHDYDTMKYGTSNTTQETAIAMKPGQTENPLGRSTSL